MQNVLQFTVITKIKLFPTDLPSTEKSEDVPDYDLRSSRSPCSNGQRWNLRQKLRNVHSHTRSYKKGFKNWSEAMIRTGIPEVANSATKFVKWTRLCAMEFSVTSSVVIWGLIFQCMSFLLSAITLKGLCPDNSCETIDSKLILFVECSIRFVVLSLVVGCPVGRALIKNPAFLSTIQGGTCLTGLIFCEASWTYVNANAKLSNLLDETHSTSLVCVTSFLLSIAISFLAHQICIDADVTFCPIIFFTVRTFCEYFGVPELFSYFLYFGIMSALWIALMLHLFLVTIFLAAGTFIGLEALKLPVSGNWACGTMEFAGGVFGFQEVVVMDQKQDHDVIVTAASDQEENIISSPVSEDFTANPVPEANQEENIISPDSEDFIVNPVADVSQRQNIVEPALEDYPAGLFAGVLMDYSHSSIDHEETENKGTAEDTHLHLLLPLTSTERTKDGPLTQEDRVSPRFFSGRSKTATAIKKPGAKPKHRWRHKRRHPKENSNMARPKSGADPLTENPSDSDASSTVSMGRTHRHRKNTAIELATYCVDNEHLELESCVVPSLRFAPDLESSSASSGEDDFDRSPPVSSDESGCESGPWRVRTNITTCTSVEDFLNGSRIGNGCSDRELILFNLDSREVFAEDGPVCDEMSRVAIDETVSPEDDHELPVVAHDTVANLSDPVQLHSSFTEDHDYETNFCELDSLIDNSLDPILQYAVLISFGNHDAGEVASVSPAVSVFPTSAFEGGASARPTTAAFDVVSSPVTPMCPVISQSPVTSPVDSDNDSDDDCSAKTENSGYKPVMDLWRIDKATSSMVLAELFSDGAAPPSIAAGELLGQFCGVMGKNQNVSCRVEMCTAVVKDELAVAALVKVQSRTTLGDAISVEEDVIIVDRTDSGKEKLLRPTLAAQISSGNKILVKKASSDGFTNEVYKARMERVSGFDKVERQQSTAGDFMSPGFDIPVRPPLAIPVGLSTAPAPPPLSAHGTTTEFNAGDSNRGNGLEDNIIKFRRTDSLASSVDRLDRSGVDTEVQKRAVIAYGPLSREIDDNDGTSDGNGDSWYVRLYKNISKTFGRKVKKIAFLNRSNNRVCLLIRFDADWVFTEGGITASAHGGGFTLKRTAHDSPCGCIFLAPGSKDIIDCKAKRAFIAALVVVSNPDPQQEDRLLLLFKKPVKRGKVLEILSDDTKLPSKDCSGFFYGSLFPNWSSVNQK